MEEFEFDNILDQSEIDNLFSDDSTEESLEENPSTSNEEKPNNKNNTVEETVNPENLFSPESVDSNEEDDGG